MIMAPLVLAHLAVIVFATAGGLSVSEILARTQGSIFWGAFYGLFVLAAAVHGSLGLRVIVHETTGLARPGLDLFTYIVLLGLLYLGASAVVAVTLPR